MLLVRARNQAPSPGQVRPSDIQSLSCLDVPVTWR